VRVKAYEPALASIMKATEQLRAQTVAAAELTQVKTKEALKVSKEWWEQQQPMIQAAQKVAMEQSMLALARLQEWQKQLEPLAIQLKDKTVEAYEKQVVPAAIEARTSLTKNYEVVSAKVMETTLTWRDQLGAQTKVWMKELEEPTKAAREWLLRTAHCMCLPFAPDAIKFKGMEEDYPPPVTAPGAHVDPVP